MCDCIMPGLSKFTLVSCSGKQNTSSPQFACRRRGNACSPYAAEQRTLKRLCPCPCWVAWEAPMAETHVQGAKCCNNYQCKDNNKAAGSVWLSSSFHPCRWTDLHRVLIPFTLLIFQWLTCKFQMHLKGKLFLKRKCGAHRWVTWGLEEHA